MPSNNIQLQAPGGGAGDVEKKTFEAISSAFQANHDVSPQQAAEEINKLVPTENLNENAEGFLWDFWATVIKTGQQIPYNDHLSQQRLVEIIQALKKYPAKEVTIWDNKTKIWQDLPLLGAQLREFFTGPDSTGADKWINFNSFAAHLLAANLNDGHNFAIWSLKDALEENPPESADLFRTHVLAAAQWIAYSGGELLAKAKSGPDSELEQVSIGGSLYGDKRGLTVERWEFWQKRLSELAESSPDETVKNTALHASERITHWTRRG